MKPSWQPRDQWWYESCVLLGCPSNVKLVGIVQDLAQLRKVSKSSSGAWEKQMGNLIRQLIQTQSQPPFFDCLVSLDKGDAVIADFDITGTETGALR